MALRETDAVCELLLRSYNTGVLSRFQTFRTENPRLSTTDAIDLFMESTNTEPDTRTRYLLLDWHNLNPTPATLQCSFCQIPYQSQYIMPLCFSEETDWRNKWVGACYGCATCDTSSVPWFQFEELLADPNSLIAEHAPYNTIAEHPDLAAMISDHTIAPPTLQIAVPETDDAHDAYITVHRWDQANRRWIRVPALDVKNRRPFTLEVFSKLCRRAWRRRLDYMTNKAVGTIRTNTHMDMMDSLREIHPGTSNNHLRRLISDHSKFLAETMCLDLINLAPEDRRDLFLMFHKWEMQHLTEALRANSTGTLLEFLDSDDYPTHLTDFITRVLPSTDEHFICRRQSCKAVVHSSHWLRATANITEHGHFFCPECLQQYHPWKTYSDAKAASRGEALTAAGQDDTERFVPAQKCLVVRATAGAHETDQLAEAITGDDDRRYMLYLLRCEEDTTGKLIQQMKVHINEIASDLRQAKDPRAYLADMIMNNMQTAQKLPYMHRTFWTQEKLEQVAQRNLGRVKPLRVDLLPSQKRQRHQPATPFYDMRRYRYDPSSTRILESSDLARVMGLCFCRLKLWTCQDLEGADRLKHLSAL